MKREIISRSKLTSLIGWKPKELTIYERDKIVVNELLQEEDGTYSKFHAKYADTNPKIDLDRQIVLVKGRSDIILMHQDSLEAIRKQKGLDKYREELLQEIYDNISYEEGVDKLLNFLNTKGRSLLSENRIKTAESIEDIAKVAPDISAAEIAWFSTLREIPNIYFNKSRNTPTILDFNIEGIEFGFDGLDAEELQRENSFDPYIGAGFTEIAEGAELYLYRQPFKKAFSSLGMLILSDAYVYQSVYSSNRINSLIKGDGKLKKAIILENPTKFGLSINELEGKRIKELNMNKETILKIEQIISNNLACKNILDLGRDSLCSPIELVAITGMLDKVPEIFLTNNQFNGYFLPFGKGLKILGADGKEIEYVPFSEYLQLESQESLHYLSSETSRKSALFSMVFNEYARGIEAKFLDERLPIDRLRKIFISKYGINISARSEKILTTEENPIIHSFGRTSGLDNERFSYTLKMGATDLEAILGVIENIPKKLVPEIKSIKKEYANVDGPEMFIGGVQKAGQYIPRTKEIISFVPKDLPEEDLLPIEEQNYKDTIAHELAHGIWESLEQTKKSKWRRISNADWETEANEEYKKSFVYNIEVQREAYKNTNKDDDEEFIIDNHALKEEDFCEHFSAYINHAVEFRELSNESKRLKGKYKFFRELFETNAENNENIEFNSNPFVSLKTLYSHKRHLIKERSLKEALMLADEYHNNREKMSIKIREEVIPSIEAQNLTKEEIEAHNHIYGQKNPEHLYLLQEVSSFVEDEGRIVNIDPAKLLYLVENNHQSAVKYLNTTYRKVDGKLFEEFIDDLSNSIRDFREDQIKIKKII